MLISPALRWHHSVAYEDIVIILVAKALNKFRESAIVKKVFYGLRPASTALITAAGLGVAKITLLHWDIFRESGLTLDIFNWKCILLAVVIFIVFKKVKHSPIYYIFAAAIIGIVFQL